MAADTVGRDFLDLSPGDTLAPREVEDVAVSTDPQLNVILATLGVACIVGALVFSGSGQVSGLLFILGIDVGISLGMARGLRTPLVVGVLALTVGLWGWKTASMDLGIVVGAVLATAASGGCSLHRIPARAALAAIVAGGLIGYAVRVALG
jgi:hypothetical protein